MLARAVSEKAKRQADVKQSPLRRALLVLACALLVPLVPFLIVGELPGERWLEAGGQTAPKVAMIGAALLALDVLLPVPSSLLGALLGGRLGFIAGFAATFVGLCASSAIGFLLGRLVPARLSKATLEQDTPSAALLFLSRPIPVFAEATSLAAGATRMPLRLFATVSALGNALYAAALAANGALLLPDGLAGPGLVLPMLVPVAGWLAFRKLTNKH